MKNFLIILSILFLSALPLFGQLERSEIIIIPVSSLGDVSNTRKKILENTLTQELSKHFQILPQDRFEQVRDQVFKEIELDACTEDQCIMRIQEILQIENLFHLELIGEEGDTQLNLVWINLDEKKNREDYCEDCKTKELRARVVGLVEKLVGKKTKVIVEKKIKGILYGRDVGGGTRWYISRGEKKDSKYEGEIKNGIPNGEGYLTNPDGSGYVGEFKDGLPNGQGMKNFFDGQNYVGEFKDGRRHGQGTYTYPDGRKYVG